MTMNKAQGYIYNQENEAQAVQLGKISEYNTMNSNKMTVWFKKSAVAANKKYCSTFDEKKQLLELQELFTKFDFDGSGTLDLDELVQMFQMAGLRVQSSKLKEMFYLAKGVKIVKNEVDLEQFQKLMLSPELDQAFRKLLKEIRRRFKYNDFSMVDPEVGFLPSDLSLMLGYLYKRSIRKNISEQIVSDKIKSTAGMPMTDLFDSLYADINRFTNLFHLHDDASYDVELRQRYCIGPLERKFRSDQRPERREQVTRLRGITTFFLNRIRERAVQHSNMKTVIDKSLLKKNPPALDDKRVMKMASNVDRIEVSIENLHRIQEERKIQEEEKAQRKHNVSGIMQSLNSTLNKSQQLDKSLGVNKSIDMSNIENKEERELYELLQSLNENLGVLDGVREVFERDGAGTDGDDSGDELLRERSRESSQEEATRILDGIPTPKKVTKGRAVFIVPDKAKQESVEAKKAKRNAAIARMMQEQTSPSDDYSSRAVAPESKDQSSREKYSLAKNAKLLKDQMRQRHRVNRNASTLLHKSQLSGGGKQSPFGQVIIDDNNIQAQGRSVMNKYSHFKSPFKEQLELDSKDLIVELLEKNNEHNLTDFQKQTLKHLRNPSIRSKMIVFGDCVNQFENMVDRRSKLYQSMQGFKQINMGSQGPVSRWQSQSVQSRYREPGSGNVEQEQQQQSASMDMRNVAPESPDSIQSKQEDQTQLQTQQVTTPSKQQDSLFSLHLNDPVYIAKDPSNVNLDLDSELGGFKPSNQTVLMPLKASQQLALQKNNRDNSRQNNLLLMSQKMQIFASPTHGRDHQKQQSGSITILSKKQGRSKGSTDDRTQSTADQQTQDKNARTGSHQILPAIQQSNSIVSGPHRNLNQGNMFQSAQNEQVHMSQSQMARAPKPKKRALFRQLETEPEIDHKTPEPRFRRNFTSGQHAQLREMQDNLSQLAIKTEKKQSQEWTPGQQHRTTVDYNFGGYVQKKSMNKDKMPSFFNSRQADKSQDGGEDSQINLSATLKTSQQKKNLRQMLNMKDQQKMLDEIMSPQQQPTEFVAHQTAFQLKGKHFDKLNVAQGKSRQKQLTEDAANQAQQNEQDSKMIQLISKASGGQGEETINSNKTKPKKKRKKNKNSKSPGKQQDEVNSDGSVKKIMIVPPQGMHHALQHRGTKPSVDLIQIPQGALPSLGASSLNRQSDLSSRQGLPSLAAAQLRSMTRKQAMKSSPKAHKKKLTKQVLQESNNKTGISGVFGDAIQPPLDTSYIQKDESPRDKRKRYRQASQEREVQRLHRGSTVQHANNAVDYQQHLMKQNYGSNYPMNTQDADISVQRSLLGNSQFDVGSYYKDNKQPQQSLVSSSSGGEHQPKSVFGMTMTDNRPMYDGEINVREAPSSSQNLLLQQNQIDKQYKSGFPKNPHHHKQQNQQDFAMEKSKSRSTKQFEQMRYFNESQTREAGSKFANTDGQEAERGKIDMNLGAQEIKLSVKRQGDLQITDDQVIGKQLEKPKKSTPFQQFQDRMQQLGQGTHPHGSKGMAMLGGNIAPQDSFFESPKRHSASGVSTAGFHTSQNESANYRSKVQWNSTDWNQQSFNKFQNKPPYNIINVPTSIPPIQSKPKGVQAVVPYLEMKQMSPSMNQQMRRRSNEEIVSSMQESQVLSVTKIKMAKNNISTGKLHTIGEPQNNQNTQQEETQQSIVQTDFIDESKNLSRIGSQEDGIINSSPIKNDPPKLSAEYQVQQIMNNQDLTVIATSEALDTEPMSQGITTYEFSHFKAQKQSSTGIGEPDQIQLQVGSKYLKTYASQSSGGGNDTEERPEDARKTQPDQEEDGTNPKQD